MISNKKLFPCCCVLAPQQLSGQLKETNGALHRQTVTDSRETPATANGSKVEATVEQLSAGRQEPLPPSAQAIAEVPEEEAINFARDNVDMLFGTRNQDKP